MANDSQSYKTEKAKNTKDQKPNFSCSTEDGYYF